MVVPNPDETPHWSSSGAFTVPVVCGLDANLVVALVSLLLAGGALIYAKRAADAADASLTLTREEAQRSRLEHEEFLRQLRARARFEVTLTAEGADENGVITSDATVIYVTVEVGLRNVGEKAAGPTFINLLVPRSITHFRLMTAAGGEDPQQARPVPETLAADGDEVAAQYLSMERERTPRRTSFVRRAFLQVPVPDAGESVVPLRVKVESDDLADDEPEVVREMLLRVRRPVGG